MIFWLKYVKTNCFERFVNNYIKFKRAIFYFAEAITEISGGTERYIQVGSSVHLVCTIKDFQEPPTYVFWYHEDQMINYDNRRQVRITLYITVNATFLASYSRSALHQRIYRYISRRNHN